MMNNIDHIIIFTDLDACLLDDSYSFWAANEAIGKITEMNIPLVFNSSKTLDELTFIAKQFPKAPFIIAENGTNLAVPIDSPLANIIHSNETISGYKCIYDRGVREGIMGIINMLKSKYNYRFRCFSTMSDLEISNLTGLDLDSTARAKNRISTEPIIWEGSKEEWREFKGVLSSLSIKAVLGGQFIHLMNNGYDKGLGMINMLSLFKQHSPKLNWVSVALGDSPNDIPMLENADYPIVIPNPKHGTLGINNPNGHVSDLFSSQGWNEAMLNFLSKSLNIVKL